MIDILLFHHGIQQVGNHEGMKLTTLLPKGCCIGVKKKIRNKIIIKHAAKNKIKEQKAL
jgi:hypothetical protein